MKVYIAGKITGYAGYKEKFFETEMRLNFAFHTVLNPAVMPKGMEAADYMRICFAMIDSADAVYFMPDHEGSRGAMLEKTYCEYIGKPMFFDLEKFCKTGEMV